MRGEGLMHGKLTRLGTTVAALTVLVSCGAPQETRTAEAGRTGAEPSGRPERLTDAQEAKLAWAEQLLIQRCMERKGLRYWPGRPPGPDELKNTTLFIDDVRWARRHGYGGELERKAEKEQKKDRNTAYLEGLSDRERARWDRALFGSEDSRVVNVRLPAGGRVGTRLDGCVAKARDGLYGDLGKWFRASKVAENLTPLYADDLTRDRAYRDAVREWSHCMRGKGHDYDSPEKIRKRLPELNERLAPDRAHAAEVRLAVAEARCARSSGLGRTARRLEQQYRDKVIGKRYRAEVDAYLRLARRALTKAEAVTARRG